MFVGSAFACSFRYFNMSLPENCCATNRKVAGSILAGVNGFFIDIKSFRLHFGPVVDSTSNRNEYQEYFLGGKGGRCVRLTTYHHPVPLSRNLGTLTSWNPMGPSGPVTGLLYLYLYLSENCPINSATLFLELYLQKKKYYKSILFKIYYRYTCVFNNFIYFFQVSFNEDKL